MLHQFRHFLFSAQIMLFILRFLFYFISTVNMCDTLLLTYKALNGVAPAHLASLLSHYNPSHSLRSQNFGLLEVPKTSKSTNGGRAF